MGEFRWKEYNDREFEECGISIYARSISSRLFTQALKAKMAEFPDGARVNAEQFFMSVFVKARDLVTAEMADAVKRMDFEFIREFDQIIHALSHYTRYAMAQAAYNKSAEKFEAAVHEMID